MTTIKKLLIKEHDGTTPNQLSESVVMLGPDGSSFTDRFYQDQWDDLRVPFNSVKVGAVRPPEFVQWRDDGAGSTGLFGWAFSSTAQTQVFFDAQIPHTYKEGSRLAPHCHFVPTTAPTVGQTVRFGLEYSWANVWGTFPTTTTIYAERTFVEGINDQQYQQMIGGFDPDIEESTMEVSATLSCRFFRDATHANDTYTGDIVVLEFDFHYLVESFGSIEEFSK